VFCILFFFLSTEHTEGVTYALKTPNITLPILVVIHLALDSYRKVQGLFYLISTKLPSSALSILPIQMVDFFMMYIYDFRPFNFYEINN